jgi:hypothetical protein
LTGDQYEKSWPDLRGTIKKVFLVSYPTPGPPIQIKKPRYETIDTTMKIDLLPLPVIALCMTAVSSHAATIVYNFSAGDALVDLANNSADSATSAATSNDFGSGITGTVVPAR